MTLAAILLTSVFWIVPAASDGASPTFELAPQTAPVSQDQTTTPPPVPAPQAKPSSPGPSPAKPHATASQSAKKPIHKKKLSNSGCDGAAGTSAPSSSSTAGTADGANAPAQKPVTSNAPTNTPPTNCPPEKIIVRHGGTTEPSIQLAGGPGGQQASQTRDETTQMLGTAETNLKKLTGQQLSSDQKDSVTQIREFMEQSRSALAAGDNERAHTLATKAKLLSEDLVQPQK